MNIETLEKRVCELEHLVFGPTKSVKRLTTEHEKNLVDQLYELYSAMSVAEKRPVSSKLLSRINEIQKYTDPNFMEDDTLLAKSKIEIILAQRDRIEKIGSDLEKISKLRDCLNHPAFGEISTLKQKFEDLRMVHNDQYVMSEKLIADTQALLDTYHNLIRDTSKLFIYWNQRALATGSSVESSDS
ncbi:unnamed protein product [Schistosoma margrebowiei]|uniref:Dynactin subunit 3 n=1 Tax=Schistosoma margrebowiei TaxID=48269 RepID=A0AA85AEI8_9TREM|nr:unnamed protein product [Schistosoma margrebowiei]